MARVSGLRFVVVAMALVVFLLAAAGLASPAEAHTDSCLADLQNALGTVLPHGVICQSQGACSVAADTASLAANSWIDAGTGIVSTSRAATASADPVSPIWMDAGAHMTGQAAVQAPVSAQANTWMDAGTRMASTADPAAAKANAWIDAGTGIAGGAHAAPAVSCATTGAGPANQ
jgi:hypothetical protein